MAKICVSFIDPSFHIILMGEKIACTELAGSIEGKWMVTDLWQATRYMCRFIVIIRVRRMRIFFSGSMAFYYLEFWLYKIIADILYLFGWKHFRSSSRTLKFVWFNIHYNDYTSTVTSDKMMICKRCVPNSSSSCAPDFALEIFIGLMNKFKQNLIINYIGLDLDWQFISLTNNDIRPYHSYFFTFLSGVFEYLH